MKPNQIIRSKKDLLKHFGASRKLEILDSEQMKDLLEMNISPEVWDDASNRNLLFISEEFVQETQEFVFNIYGGIKYIYLVSFLTNLTELNLQNNIISDISSISKLKNLKKINFGSNWIEDISALQSLPDLTHLDLQVNQLTSYTLALPNLVYLSLRANKLKDISGLQCSPKLESLDLPLTETTDICTIPPQLFGLKVLKLDICIGWEYYRLQLNNITEISHISNFVDLQILSLHDNNQLQNIGPLKFCTLLTELNISQTSVSDIWPLQFMKNLKTLDMYVTKVVDLHPLQYLYKLEIISAYDACIMDVSPLSKLTQLKSVSFSGNKIANADTIQRYKKFSEYNLSDQKAPTADELKFYNKIIKVHSSHKQIRKIYNENRTQKFKKQMTHQKEQIKFKINEQTQVMNKRIEIICSQNSYADQ
ncbi:leucine-rich_repeat domain-containing protein [Hexamita inflata]|uniref:Partial n=1 Tax=Hexamita inflata TaxID=28002 RepID=A0AA86QJY2_9EUKA|nr:leucine-rich repeat domain-containing protein [Hexamita inflata]